MKRAVALALTLGVALSVAAPAMAAPKSQPMNQRQSAMQPAAPAAPELRLVKTLEGEDSYSILRPAFSRDGRYLAANLNESKSIRVWDTQTGEVAGEIPADVLFGNNQLVDGLEFTRDGQHIVVLRAGQPLKQIDWRTQEIVRTIDLGVRGNKIEDYAFTPDQKWLVLGTQAGIELIDFAQGTRASHLLDGQHVTSLDISRDGKWVAFGKRGQAPQSVGLIDLATKTVSRYPLANLTPEQQKMLPANQQVRHVCFEEGTNGLLIGYMAIPEGSYQPTGPASVCRVDLKTGQMSGPRTLSSNMLSFDPVSLGRPFNTTFFNTYELGAGSAASAADFLSPRDLSPVKTLTHADLNAPMLTFRVSPDQKWLAGSFKEQDGKVRVRLYEIAPEQREGFMN